MHDALNKAGLNLDTTVLVSVQKYSSWDARSALPVLAHILPTQLSGNKLTSWPLSNVFIGGYNLGGNPYIADEEGSLAEYTHAILED